MALYSRAASVIRRRGGAPGETERLFLLPCETTTARLTKKLTASSSSRIRHGDVPLRDLRDPAARGAAPSAGDGVAPQPRRAGPAPSLITGRRRPLTQPRPHRQTPVKAQPMKEEFPVMHPGQLARNPALGLLLQLGHCDSCGATDLAKCKVLGLLVLFMYKETVQECVSEFISFITSEVSEKCKREKRKTSNGDDLLWAMATLGFEEYIEPLKVYL